MGKLLKVLTVVFLILSAAALYLGVQLFSKREVLKGRTQKLENAVISLGTFIESEPAEPQTAAFSERDMSDCTAELLESPELSDFWRTYSLQLEKQNLPTMELAPRRAELMSYYQRDPVTQKIKRDEMGYPVTKGKGTMQYVLDDVLNKAQSQLQRLNETRHELKVVREELVATIDDLNARKSGLREALIETEQSKAALTEQEELAAQAQKQAEELRQQKQAAADELAAERAKSAKLEDEAKDMQANIKNLKARLATAGASMQQGAEPLMARKIDTGVKGSVAAVNPSWNFAVVKLTDEFVIAMLGEDKSGEFQPIELLVKRADSSGTFVTKVRLTQIKRDQNLAIADILGDWQQAPVEDGDILFY